MTTFSVAEILILASRLLRNDKFLNEKTYIFRQIQTFGKLREPFFNGDPVLTDR